MSYTVDVTHSLYGEHQTGSKFYELCLLRSTTNNGRGCLIRRYDGLAGADYKGKTLVQSGEFASLKREFDALIKKKRDYKLAAGSVRAAISVGTRPVEDVLEHYKSTSNFRAIQEAFEMHLKEGGATTRSAAAAATKQPQVDGWGAW
jgi:hypothetical protein